MLQPSNVKTEQNEGVKGFVDLSAAYGKSLRGNDGLAYAVTMT